MIQSALQKHLEPIEKEEEVEVKKMEEVEVVEEEVDEEMEEEVEGGGGIESGG